MSLDKITTNICSRMKNKLDIVPYGKPVFIKGSEGYVVALSVDSLKDALDTYKIRGELIAEANGSYTAVIYGYGASANAFTTGEAKLNATKVSIEKIQDDFERITAWGNTDKQMRKSIMGFLKVLIEDDPYVFASKVDFTYVNRREQASSSKKWFWR